MDLYDKENIVLSMEEYLYRWVDVWAMTVEMETFKSYHGKLDYIKKYYDENEQAILETFNKSKKAYYNCYPLDWAKIFTPIELDAWHCIRMKGVVLYPQYPVLNYHIDFANPGLKIALELDGAEFHNKERDLIRDNKLRDIGWTVFRISGKEMMRTNFKTLESSYEDDYERIEEIGKWILETGDGVIEAIKIIYFEDHNKPFYKTNIGNNFFNFCEKTLRDHQLKEGYNG